MRIVLAVTLLLTVTGCGRENDRAENFDLNEAIAANTTPMKALDGRTLEIRDVAHRIATIDAPRPSPEAGCPAEAMLAEQARLGLEAIVGVGWGLAPTVTDEGAEPDGARLVRITLPDGTDVGQAMIERRLALPRTAVPVDWCGAR